MKTQHKNISKLMSLVLRHDPSYLDVELDANGWIDINLLIVGMQKKGIKTDIETIYEVVESNDKQRFALNEARTKVRANQGHSIIVDVELEESIPPKFLLHGTVAKFLPEIKKNGLLKMSRQHVHLSAELETALKVGERRGQAIILTVNSKQMTEDGYLFIALKTMFGSQTMCHSNT